jgi:5-methyltetrahydropteroyltriglutamate--homocysteine methyltransferase
MALTSLPFRADQVGSLLRSKRLADARASYQAGQMAAAELASVEDQEIRALVGKQEEIGMQAVTDGEYRRAWWHYDFFGGLSGVCIEAGQGIQFHGIQTKSQVPVVRGKIGFAETHPFLGHFNFLNGVCRETPKMMIPSPSMLYYRGGRGMFRDGLYSDIDEYYADLTAAYAQCADAFYKAGCRYLQLDDVSFAYLCDPNQREMLRGRGDDPEDLRERNIKMINDAFGDRPRDMTLAMHLCRGNFRSTFVASGGYEPIADALFNRLDIDAYFLEWDNDRAGGFEPLRHLPADKRVVLGLITTKTGTLEDTQAIKQRIDEAAKFAPLENLCLSPQCGFASTEDGNAIAEGDQWRKLALVREIADEVWR